MVFSHTFLNQRPRSLVFSQLFHEGRIFFFPFFRWIFFFFFFLPLSHSLEIILIPSRAPSLLSNFLTISQVLWLFVTPLFVLWSVLFSFCVLFWSEDSNLNTTFILRHSLLIIPSLFFSFESSNPISFSQLINSRRCAPSCVSKGFHHYSTDIFHATLHTTLLLNVLLPVVPPSPHIPFTTFVCAH